MRGTGLGLSAIGCWRNRLKRRFLQIELNNRLLHMTSRQFFSSVVKSDLRLDTYRAQRNKRPNFHVQKCSSPCATSVRYSGGVHRHRKQKGFSFFSEFSCSFHNHARRGAPRGAEGSQACIDKTWKEWVCCDIFFLMGAWPSRSLQKMGFGSEWGRCWSTFLLW